MRRSKTLITVSLTLIGLLLTAGVVSADLKATNWVDAWDILGDPVPMYRHSNVALPLDGSWLPFWHELDFDADVYPTAEDLAAGYPEPCGPGTSTPWAGIMEYGLYHVDNGPPGGHGFQESRNWELVHCSRDGDTDYDWRDRRVVPPSFRNTIMVHSDPGFSVLTQDEVVACTTGNCESEIVTTIFVNLDLDCDGVQDVFGDGGVCFYAEAMTPPPDPPMWGGNVQARVTAGGGDMTVNFNPTVGLTPVKLSSFTARWFDSSSQSVILWAVVSVLGVAALGVAIWRLRPAQR